MLGRLPVLVLVAVYLLGFAAGDYSDVKTADNEFLMKQKKVYQLLWHVSQPSIVNPQLYTEGQTYDIEANIDSYINKEAVKDFLSKWHWGMLHRGEIFSVYYPRLLDECTALFKVFYYAKDFDTFYKTALWARAHVNEAQFIIALYNAVTHRPDTKYIQLPPFYEMYPYSFFNSEVLEKAHHGKLFGKLDTTKTGTYDTYIIHANYSGWYLTYEYDREHKLNYLTEDIGWNTYYFHLKMDKPFWLSSEEFGFPKYRGEEYLYAHKQILNRYYLERLSNDLPMVEDFDWHKEFYVGYYPTMTYHNALPLPQRPYWSNFPYYKFKYIKDIHDMESRISTAIDSGFVMDTDSKFVNIYTMEGLNILGNMIEGNKDSRNPHLYGSIDHFGRKILGFNLEPSELHLPIPSALETFSSAMRDPAFYRLYKRICGYYHKYKMHQGSYTKDEIVYPTMKVESFAVDKLVTYFDQFDSSISHAMMVESQKEAESHLVKVRQYRLNNKPFTFHITINSEKSTKAAIRIFMGPKYDAHHREMDFMDSHQYFYEMDNWMMDLEAGMNKIERQSKDCIFTMPDPESSEMFYNKIEKALNGGEAMTYTERIHGFPARLLLPRGKKEGMPFQLFIHVSPVLSEPVQYQSRTWGDYKFDNRPIGYPLDRTPLFDYHHEGPNMFFKDVMIFHKDEHDMNVTY